MKTIPEQLSEALANIETLNGTIKAGQDQLKTANESLASARDQVATLTKEKEALAQQVADANATITSKSGEVAKLTKERDDLSAKEQDLAKRADARAVEIMAKVGQPAPVKTQANTGGQSADKPVLTGESAAAEYYRQKYGIS